MIADAIALDVRAKGANVTPVFLEDVAQIKVDVVRRSADCGGIGDQWSEIRWGNGIHRGDSQNGGGLVKVLANAAQNRHHRALRASCALKGRNS